MARLALVFLALVGTATAAVQPPEPATPAPISDPRAAAALVALDAARGLDPATVGQALAGAIAMPPGLDARVLGKLFERPGSSVALPPSKEVENHLKDLAAPYVLGAGGQGFNLASTPIGNVLFPPEKTPATHQEMGAEQSSPATKLISSSSAAAAGFFFVFFLL